MLCKGLTPFSRFLPVYGTRKLKQQPKPNNGPRAIENNNKQLIKHNIVKAFGRVAVFIDVFFI
jgi:hypothetical protein